MDSFKKTKKEVNQTYTDAIYLETLIKTARLAAHLCEEQPRMLENGPSWYCLFEILEKAAGKVTTGVSEVEANLNGLTEELVIPSIPQEEVVNV